MLITSAKRNSNTSLKSTLRHAVFAVVAFSGVAMSAQSAVASELIAQGSEGMSQGSGYIVEGSFLTAVGAASAVGEGSEWVVRGIEDGGESVMITVGNASAAGAEVSFSISKGTAEALGLAVNAVLELGLVTAEGTSNVIGYTLSQGGKVMLYLAKEAGDMRTGSEKF